MNRKTKKKVTTVVILLFFLAAGLWYFFRDIEFSKKTKNDTELTSVLDTITAEVSITPSPEQAASGKKTEKASEVVVYVCGAVNEPGIYTLGTDSRLYEAIALAGGFSVEADPAYHNLARSISDGERIYILSVSETKALTTEQQVTGEEGAEVIKGNAKINLNTATAEQLMELPGIGEAKAAGILEYRARIGQFAAIEEIMNVSGIGEAMFERIKDKITVK